MNKNKHSYSQMKHRQIFYCRGFTLVELLIGIALVAILVAIGIPNLNSFINHIRTIGLTNEVVSDLSFARSEAIKGGKIIRLEAAGGKWNDGWQVIDVENNNEMIKEHGPLLKFGEEDDAPAFTLIVEGDIDSVTFGRNGALNDPASGVTFEICRPDNDTAKSRTVLLGLAGHLRTEKGATSCGE